MSIQMNMSEVQNNNSKDDFVVASMGWVCPRCGKAWGPKVQCCTCSKPQQESANKSKWIKD